jgi:hypothetical protein
MSILAAWRAAHARQLLYAERNGLAGVCRQSLHQAGGKQGCGRQQAVRARDSVAGLGANPESLHDVKLSSAVRVHYLRYTIGTHAPARCEAK